MEIFSSALICASYQITVNVRLGLTDQTSKKKEEVKCFLSIDDTDMHTDCITTGCMCMDKDKRGYLRICCTEKRKRDAD